MQVPCRLSTIFEASPKENRREVEPFYRLPLCAQPSLERFARRDGDGHPRFVKWLEKGVVAASAAKRDQPDP